MNVHANMSSRSMKSARPPELVLFAGPNNSGGCCCFDVDDPPLISASRPALLSWAIRGFLVCSLND